LFGRKIPDDVRSWRLEAVHACAAVAGIAAMTLVSFRWLHVTDATTVALSYLLLILFVAASSHLWVALVTSVVAALALNYYFLPPIFTLNIDESQDWIAFVTFIVVSFVASNLSSLARRRERELSRLFEFSRDALADSGDDALGELAGYVALRFHLRYVAFCMTANGDFTCKESGSGPHRLMPTATELHATAEGRLPAREGLSEPFPGIALSADEHDALWLLPLRRGTTPSAILALAGLRLEPTTLRAIASVAAIAIERLRLLEQRQQSEVERRSVEIKSALLSSLAHDLRTPLTAMAAAISNLGVPDLAEPDRSHQADVARAGLDRLTRLFDNILEMARLDAGDVSQSPRWTHPMEAIEAARKQVEESLNGRMLNLADNSGEQVMYADPRLVARALAHLLENAAQYSPAASAIGVAVELVSGGVMFVVDDEGPGIDESDLPHLFERFYRGAQAEAHRAGSGMGLAIVEGMMRAQGGHVSAENRESGGARFSLFVPARTRSIADENPASADS
jgi:two-component system, OmpR family, sensor histidine kinase KdpD